MTDDIRAELKQKIAKRYPSKRQFAQHVGITPQYLEAVLSGDKINTPPRFEDILAALDLELVVQPKK